MTEPKPEPPICARLAELAERCEQAAAPDERLDAEIVAALNDALLKPYPPATDFGPHDRWQFWSLDGKHFLGSEGKYPVKTFTASLDAAMTLVPHPAWIRMDEWPSDFCHGPVASIQPIREPQIPSHVATGATLALALCAASLRARAEMERANGE